jgi:hypothetical protein
VCPWQQGKKSKKKTKTLPLLESVQGKKVAWLENFLGRKVP